MSAMAAPDEEALQLNEAALLRIGQSLRESGHKPRQVTQWFKAWCCTRTSDHRWLACSDSEAIEVMEQAIDAAEIAAEEQAIAAQIAPPPRAPETSTSGAQPPEAPWPPGASEKRAEARGAPLPGFTPHEVWNGVPLVLYLLRFILVRGGITTLFGMSGALKSTLALAMAFALSTGTPFFGFPGGAPVGVVYFVGEGFAGIRKRLRALLIEHGYDASSPEPPIYLTAAPADLFGNPQQVRATVEHAARVLGVPIGAIFIDTLTANAGPADLNDTRDMTITCHAAASAAPDAGVVLVHHVGHADQNRERGAYSLIGSADVRLQAVYDKASGVLELRFLKVKDDDEPPPVLFRPKVVDLDSEDEAGNRLTSIVLEHLEGASVPTLIPDRSGLGGNQESALKALARLYTTHRRNVEEQGRDPSEARVLISGWRAALKMKDNRFKEAREALEKRRLIRIEEPFVYLVEEPQ
jgi:hypothetical protein